MDFRDFKDYVRADLYRVQGRRGLFDILYMVLFGGPFKYVFWMRACQFFCSRRLLRFFLYPLCRLVLQRYVYRFGISIPYSTDIGKGLYIGHFGGIIVNEKCKIGRNCNISQGVTIGQTNRGPSTGSPTIGDNVYLGPGSVVIGGIHVGNNVAIGANAVVTKDVPDDSVVVGIPGRIISKQGAVGYINFVDYY